jgi:hypothetical protein
LRFVSPKDYIENQQAEELFKGDSSTTPFSGASRGRIGLTFGKNTRKNSTVQTKAGEQLGSNMLSDPTLQMASEEPISPALK